MVNTLRHFDQMKIAMVLTSNAFKKVQTFNDHKKYIIINNILLRKIANL